MSYAQEKLDEAKAKCLEGESEEDHLQHKQELEDAYGNFSQEHFVALTPPGVTNIDAAVIVNSV